MSHTARLAFAAILVALLSPSGAVAKTMTFGAGCKPGKRVTIAAVGDLLFHKSLLRQAFHRRAGFAPFWRPMKAVLADADIAYANLEGPAVHGVAAGGRRVRDPGWRIDYRVYGYRLPNLSFNYHPSLLDDLVKSGFDVVSTANNHALDRGALGIDRTIENLKDAGLAFTGTKSRQDVDRPWSVITKAGGVSVAWLACTYSTNGIPDRASQVLDCYKQREAVLAEVERLATDPAVDAVILTPHWGYENSRNTNAKQRKLAREVLDAGATAIIGAHPHVLQPWEKHTSPDGREGLIVYSLGNFISNQRRTPQRVGQMALVELVKPATGKAQVSAAGYIPTWVSIGRGHRVGPAPTRSWAMKHARRVLPKGNLTSLKSWRKLPRACPKEVPSVTAEAREETKSNRVPAGPVSLAPGPPTPLDEQTEPAAAPDDAARGDPPAKPDGEKIAHAPSDVDGDAAPRENVTERAVVREIRRRPRRRSAKKRPAKPPEPWQPDRPPGAN